MFGLFADWSILYVTVIIFGIIMAIGGIVWAICFCIGRLVPHFYVKNYVKAFGTSVPTVTNKSCESSSKTCTSDHPIPFFNSPPLNSRKLYRE